MPFVKNDPNINRLGRPIKSQSWSELIKLAGENIDILSKKQLKDLVVEQLYLKATKGDISAIKEIIDRTDGKPKMFDFKPNKTFQDEVDITNPKILKTLIETARAIVENDDMSTLGGEEQNEKS